MLNWGFMSTIYTPNPRRSVRKIFSNNLKPTRVIRVCGFQLKIETFWSVFICPSNEAERFPVLISAGANHAKFSSKWKSQSQLSKETINSQHFYQYNLSLRFRDRSHHICSLKKIYRASNTYCNFYSLSHRVKRCMKIL